MFYSKKITALMGAVVLSISSAQAADRLTQNDVSRFFKHMDIAISSHDVRDVRDFLSYNTSSVVSFDSTIGDVAPHYVGYNGYAYDRGYYGYNRNAWNVSGNWDANPYYYRYPHYNAGFRATGVRRLDKSGMINLFENKKASIPGYSLKTSVLKVQMPAGAQSAVVDLDVKEFGLAYAGYAPGFSRAAPLSNSTCKAHLQVLHGQTVLSRLNCNMISAIPQ